MKRRVKRWGLGLAGAVIGACLFLAGAFASEAQAASCAGAVKLCARSGAKLGAGVAKTLLACEAVRLCRRECKAEKRMAASQCRETKSDCAAACRTKHGRGRGFRQCRRACRKDKRGCTRETRQEKRGCRRVCRASFLTPACRKARVKIVGSSLRTVGACATLASCVKPAP